MPDATRMLALLAALLLVGTAALPATGLAQDEEPENETDDPEDEADQEREDEADDERDEDERDEEKRSVEISREGDDFEISLERESGEQEDKVEMAWKAEEATFELEYEAENETQELEQKLEAVFGALGEYEDANDNGQYDDGEALASAWALGDEDAAEDLDTDGRADWQPVTVQDVTVDGTDGKKLTATATLEDEGNVTLRFLVFGDFVEVNGTSLAPTGAKIDIVVEDYPYQENGTDLALFLETETENEFELEDDEDDEDEGDETGVTATSRINGTEVDLTFAWKDTAQVDGATEDVATTLLEEESEVEQEDGERSAEQKRSFVLSYPRGDNIVHDPRAEVNVQSSAASDVPAPGALPALAALVGVAGLLVARRDQR